MTWRGETNGDFKMAIDGQRHIYKGKRVNEYLNDSAIHVLHKVYSYSVEYMYWVLYMYTSISTYIYGFNDSVRCNHVPGRCHTLIITITTTTTTATALRVFWCCNMGDCWWWGCCWLLRKVSKMEEKKKEGGSKGCERRYDTSLNTMIWNKKKETGE